MTEITNDDADFIVKLRQDPDNYRYFKYPHKININEHLKWFTSSYLNNNNRYDFIAYKKTNPQIKLGIYGFKIIKKNELVEINYMTDRYHRGQGIATEAVNGIINFVSNQFQVNSFIAEIHKNNIASISFAKKLGFYIFKNDNTFIIYRLDKKN